MGVPGVPGDSPNWVLQREPLKCGPYSPPSDCSAFSLGSLLWAPRNIKMSPWRQPRTGPHGSHVDHRKDPSSEQLPPRLSPACPSQSSKSSQAQCVNSPPAGHISTPEGCLSLSPSVSFISRERESLSMVLITCHGCKSCPRQPKFPSR